jgi:hypothetical protein
MDIKVDRLLWESLEGIFQIHGRNYVRGVARTLQIDEKDLLRKVFGADNKIKVSLIDTGAVTTQCQAYTRTGSIVHHCRKAVVTGTTYCSSHQTIRPNIIESVSGVIELKKLADSPDRESLWIKEDGEVVGADGQFRGLYDQETCKLKLFLVAEAEA